MMTRLGLRAGTWMLAGAFLAMLAAACGASSRATSPSTGSGYQLSTVRLQGDDPALDRGVLTYSMLTSLQVQQTTSFDVEVTDVGKGPDRGVFARVTHGRFVAPQDVPAGGFVSVRSICSGGLTCMPRSASTRQAIPGPGRSATWRWDVAARSPGNGQILLVATSYGRRSKIVLRETSVVVPVAVRSSPLYALKTYLDVHRAAIVLLVSGMLIVAGALAAMLAPLRTMGRASARATQPRAHLPEAETEPLRTTPDRPAPAAAPAAAPKPGWKPLLWLPPIDIAAGGLAIWIVRSSTSASLGLAVIAAAAVVAALPLYVLPVIIAYLRPAPDRTSVAIIGIFLGWTYIGWVVALALAVRDGPEVSRAGKGALLERGQDSPARTRTR